MKGIYKITNPKGRIYIGKANDIDFRMRSYKCLNCKDQPKIYNSLAKYGYDSHEIKVVAELNELDSERMLSILEWGLYHAYKIAGFEMLNCVEPDYDGGNLHTEETKRKIGIKSSERNCSEETRVKMRASSKKRFENPTERERHSKINFGRKHSTELIEKRKYTRTQEITEKIRKHTLKSIIQFDLKGNYIKEWPGASVAEKELGITKNSLSAALRGKQIIAQGFKWKFKRDIDGN